jgi:hypothetical protein
VDGQTLRDAAALQPRGGFFWFGVLKFVPDCNPAADLAARTLTTLRLGLVAPGLVLPGLAAWECLIGLGLLSGTCRRTTLLLLLLQMVGTLTLLLLFPTVTFNFLSTGGPLRWNSF